MGDVNRYINLRSTKALNLSMGIMILAVYWSQCGLPDMFDVMRILPLLVEREGQLHSSWPMLGSITQSAMLMPRFAFYQAPLTPSFAGVSQSQQYHLKTVMLSFML